MKADAKKKLKDVVNEATEPLDDIARLNAEYAVLPIGGKTRVVKFGEDAEFPGRKTIVMTQSVGDFVSLLNKYRHEYIDEDKKIKSVPLGKHWINSPGRRQYDGGMAFMPQHNEAVVGDKLNLWHGYGVKPVKPSGKSGAVGCDKFLKFQKEVICSGNEDHYDYMIKREALILQERQRSEIAIALQTKDEGAGKGFSERHWNYLYGNHAMQVTHASHVVGKHNPHLECLLRLTADEALFVGNHEHRNALFSLITEPKFNVEPKFLGVYAVRNYLNISIISNSEHFIPVSGTARRFFVPTVSTNRIGDFDYFRDIENQLQNNHGYEALLYHMLYEVDLKDFNVRKVPKTAGLAEQAAFNRRGVDRLVEEVCHNGFVPCEHGVWPGFTVTSGYEAGIGFAAYVAKHSDKELRFHGPLTAVRRLVKEWGCTTERKREGNNRTQGFVWPPLADLRKKFEERFGKQVWLHPEITEWTVVGEQEERGPL